LTVRFCLGTYDIKGVLSLNLGLCFRFKQLVELELNVDFDLYREQGYCFGEIEEDEREIECHLEDYEIYH
jgi:hypothetical protein